METPFGKTPGQRSRADAGHAGGSASIVKKWTSRKEQPSSAGRSQPVSQPSGTVAAAGFSTGGRRERPPHPVERNHPGPGACKSFRVSYKV